MNTSLLITVKAFSENVQRFIEPSHDPVAYNLNAGLLNLAKGIAELETRIQQLEATLRRRAVER